MTKLTRNIFKEGELDQNSVVKEYLTTTSDVGQKVTLLKTKDRGSGFHS